MDILLAIVDKREQKVQNTVSNKNNRYYTEYCVRLEPGMFAMQNKRHTTRPKVRIQSKVVEQSRVIRTVNKQRQSGRVSVIGCSIQ